MPGWTDCSSTLPGQLAELTLSAKRYHPDMDTRLLELLVCPVTKGPLDYNREKQELTSHSARLAYPVRDGIPILLENEARPLTDEELGL
jgi:uncharacterized protein YbaR (Trm112 family)